MKTNIMTYHIFSNQINYKKKLSSVFFSVIILLSATANYAQENTGLSDALNLALKNNNKYRIAVEKESENHAKVRESWGKLWPDLSISLSNTRWGAEKGIYSGSDGQIDFQFIKGNFQINPGDFYYTLKIAQDSYTISVLEERKIKSETISNVIRLYFLTMLNEEIIKLRTDSVKALEENLRLVTAGYKEGSLASIDHLRAKVSLANERTRLINAENDFQRTKSSLNLMLGRDITEPLALDHNSLSIDITEISSLQAMNSLDQKKTLDEFFSLAMKNRPELIQLHYKKNIAEANSNLDQSVYIWPTFFVNGNYGTTKTVNQQKLPPEQASFSPLFDKLSPPGWNKNWSVTAGVSYKWGALSPADSSHARVIEDESRKRQSDLETNDFIRQLRLEIQTGLLKIISAAHAIESQNNNTQSAQEYFRVTMLQFKNGMIDNTKLLDANVELKNAETLHIQALYDFHTAKSDLNRALGCDYFIIK